MRLFDLFKGPHWTLVGYESVAVLSLRGPAVKVIRVGPGGDIVDDDGCLSAAYGLVRGDWVLVRPDGYVAAVVGDDGTHALERHLGRILGPAIEA